MQAALIVNPFDVDGLTDALHLALGMPLEERRSRHAAMMDGLRANTVTNWRDNFLEALNATPKRS
jgi:trehalose 6-phosphate synthase